MLKELREEHALTQEQAAQLMGLSHRVTVSHLEHDQRHLKLVEFARLAVALELDDARIGTLIRSVAQSDRRKAA